MFACKLLRVSGQPRRKRNVFFVITSSLNFFLGELRNRAQFNYTKAPPAWLGGGIARSGAKTHRCLANAP